MRETMSTTIANQATTTTTTTTTTSPNKLPPSIASSGGIKVALSSSGGSNASAQKASQDARTTRKPPPSTAADAAAQPDYSSSSSHTDNDQEKEHYSVDTMNQNNKRTLMTHTKDGKVLTEKKLRRLEKNRLSARECRRRKREATENLEREINLLEADNLRLRLQLQIGKEAEKSRLREQEKLTEDINELLKSGASEADIHATLEEFKEKHADYGKSRRSAIEFHLQNIERLLMPTQTTSLVMHAIQGGDLVEANAPASDSLPSTPLSAVLNPPEAATAITPSVASSASSSPAVSTAFDPKALFRFLVNYLEVSPQQAAALKDSQRVARELDGCLAAALNVVKELRQRLAQTGDDLEAEFNTVRAILTPSQAAKFLVWVANNAACMHMLNELWDRVYPAGTFPANEE